MVFPALLKLVVALQYPNVRVYSVVVVVAAKMDSLDCMCRLLIVELNVGASGFYNTTFPLYVNLVCPYTHTMFNRPYRDQIKTPVTLSCVLAPRKLKPNVLQAVPSSGCIMR